MMLHKEIDIFLRQKSREYNLEQGFGLKFLRKKKSSTHPKITKIIPEIEKSLRSKLLKIFEDLMGKRPALEISILIIN